MNGSVFSAMGYLSVALCLSVPALWLVHELRRPRRWWCHAAVPVAVLALALAMVNSRWHVERIEVDPALQAKDPVSPQELARRAAVEARTGEVANIRFAEDNAGEFLDKGGMDRADVEYFQQLEAQDTPHWKQQKRQRSSDTDDQADDLEALIGAKEEQKQIAAPTLPEQNQAPPILMSEKDKMLADRLDAANLTTSRLMVLLALLAVGYDYLRRLNVNREIYFPLPLPSAWADAMTPRPTVQTVALTGQRTLLDGLRVIVRRGEVFMLLTDDASLAAKAVGSWPRLPGGFWPLPVLAVEDDPTLSDEFVFETLWYARSGFVVRDERRAAAWLEFIVRALARRSLCRAHTRQTVHVVWDRSTPIPDAVLRSFAELGSVAGLTLLIHQRTRPA